MPAHQRGENMSATTIAQNIYAYGQCTWWVWQQAPWIQKYGNLGNAEDWLTNAMNAGLATSSTPVVGSIAVWGGNQNGALADGHVAVVTDVLSGGLITVSQSDWPTGTINTTMTVPQGDPMGYILPPGTSGGTPGSAASTLSAGGSNPDPWASIPVIGGLTDPFWAVGEGASSVAGNVIGSVFSFLIKGMEIVFGVGILGFGIWIVIKHSGSAGQSVTNTVQVVTSGVKKAVEAGALAA